jgi:hypothetical protein
MPRALVDSTDQTARYNLRAKGHCYDQDDGWSATILKKGIFEPG